MSENNIAVLNKNRRYYPPTLNVWRRSLPFTNRLGMGNTFYDHEMNIKQLTRHMLKDHCAMVNNVISRHWWEILHVLTGISILDPTSILIPKTDLIGCAIVFHDYAVKKSAIESKLSSRAASTIERGYNALQYTTYMSLREHELFAWSMVLDIFINYGWTFSCM